MKNLDERLRRIEERLSLAKIRCRACDEEILILSENELIRCSCGEFFGDARVLLAENMKESPENLEWMNKDGYEKELLFSYVRRQVRNSFPRILSNIPPTQESE
jgi:hypothetical protein